MSDCVSPRAATETIARQTDAPSQQRVIPFTELVPGASVRVTDDGLVWAVDLTMAITGKNRNAANEVLRILNDDTFSKDRYIIRRMPGTGNTRVRLLTFEHAVELVMVLPGHMAKEFRKKAADILKRYFAGDASMHTEIEHNRLVGPLQSCCSFLDSALKSQTANVDACGMPLVSNVYAFVSPAFPGLVKIGRSKDVERRLDQANTFAAPAPFTPVAVSPTFFDVRDERAAHAFFNEFREEGEFFRVSVEDVQAYFEQHIMQQYLKELSLFVRAMHKGSPQWSADE